MPLFTIFDPALYCKSVGVLIYLAQAGQQTDVAKIPWGLFGTICVAGVVGGLGNALITDNGFILPKVRTLNEQRILRPGVFGNVIIGIIAALVFWLLNTNFDSLSDLTVVAKSIGTALVAGIGGARLLTNEVDKLLLKAAAAEAAAADSSPGTARQINTVSPARALDLAEKLPGPAPLPK